MTTNEHVVLGLIEALARGDQPALTALLAPAVQLRAVLPRRYVDVAGPAAVTGEMLGWFAEVPEIVVLQARADTVGGVWHATLRFALYGLGPRRVVEQHAYCEVQDGLITTIRLVCSGFRPEPAPEDLGRTVPAPGEPAVSGEPVAGVPAHSIDALGDGCATLTPRIAAELRAMQPGEMLSVLTDDPSAPDGIAAWSRLTGHQLVATTTEATGTRFILRRA